jgi:hypothetical protein
MKYVRGKPRAYLNDEFHIFETGATRQAGISKVFGP